jgi:hypothetical protein
MMEPGRRIDAFVRLGKLVKMFADPQCRSGDPLYEQFGEKLEVAIRQVYFHNGWFTEENVRQAFAGIAAYLDERNLREWVSRYPEINTNSSAPKKVGVIMAGNIPMVGFHDMLCVLISGNILVAKLSSGDRILLPLVAEMLIAIEPAYKDLISFAEGRMNGMDAMIATGSNNSSRYFEYYFSKCPHIIRSNRNSVAVLDGTETEEELHELGKDIFQYFGLGCRSVSKLFIPHDFDLDRVFKAIFGYKNLVDNKKYGNNYDYNKTVYLLNGDKLIENGFVLFKEDTRLSSPVATVFYERYLDDKILHARLSMDAPAIQCIVSKRKDINNTVDFGRTQCPAPWDYADGVDTLKFLLQL